MVLGQLLRECCIESDGAALDQEKANGATGRKGDHKGHALSDGPADILLSAQ